MRLILSVAAFLCAAIPAHAGLIVTLERVATGIDLPRLTIEHDGGPAVSELMLGIGDTSFNFDSIEMTSVTPELILTLVAPDTVNAGVRSDALHWLFDGMTSGSAFSGKIDIDRDLGSATVDWQTTLFNNGDAPNALLTVCWITGEVTTAAFPDDPGRDPQTPYVIRVESAQVPEPAGVTICMSGALALLTVVRLRRGQSLM